MVCILTVLQTFHVVPMCPRLPHEDVNSKKRVGLYGKERQSKHQCVLNPYLVAYLQLFGEFRSWGRFVTIYMSPYSQYVHVHVDM